MWVTRQIATHTRRIVALIDYLSAVALRRSIIVTSPHFLVELKWAIYDFVQPMILVGEKKRREKSRV